MHRTILLGVALAACGTRKTKPATDDAGATRGDAAAPVVADAAPGDAAVPDAPAIDAGLAGREPPTAESVHVEVGHAIVHWMREPRDRAQYAKDFQGRREPDGRVPFAGLDAWLAKEPADPKQSTHAVETWLDPGSTLGEGESRTHVSFWYDGKDDYRELTFRREDGRQRLVKINTNSRNYKDAAQWQRWRIFSPVAATSLGKALTAWIRVEHDLAWLVVANDKHVQVVADLWPDATACTTIAPPETAPEATLATLRCTGGDKGQDFHVVRTKDELAIRRMPAGKDVPMSTDRTIELARGAKLTFQPAP